MNSKKSMQKENKTMQDNQCCENCSPRGYKPSFLERLTQDVTPLTCEICSCHQDKQKECYHQCSSNCRRKGCNCECGEYHQQEVKECRHSWIDLNLKDIASDPAQCSKCKIIRSKWEIGGITEECKKDHPDWHYCDGSCQDRQEVKDWEKEFDEKFSSVCLLMCHGEDWYDVEDDIKSFIKSLLAQERQALVEKHIETLEKILANWGNEKMLRQQIFDLKREKARLGLTY